MKKIVILCLIVSSVFTSCTKELKIDYPAKPFIEFDANIFNAPVAPYQYTVVTRNVPFGYASASAYPLITRSSGTIKLRVNLVGAVAKGKEQTISYKVLTTPVPASPNALAENGVHFATGGTLKIPADSIYGILEINVLNTGVSSTTPREVHLELEGNSDLMVTGVSNKVAVRISQQ
ncbi:hypothetical protein LQ567_23310 [Niabella pedocola]|uniref:DUF1735 domain-containing protein n=1 Tax=Niabella pedocola TaxID=1752077 RepID=A0ABS8PZN0_9BACT|nr:hypothetical protein [Niabella pedocola]MCD2425732.1 hypothetical protein [Niabella pedocola]